VFLSRQWFKFAAASCVLYTIKRFGAFPEKKGSKKMKNPENNDTQNYRCQ